MHSNMSFEVEVYGETLGAVGTFEWFFTSVNQLMSSELRVVLKALFANFTLVIFHFIKKLSQTLRF